MIRYLKRKAIQLDRWDEAVALDPSGLPYAQGRYLDAVCDQQWGGLVKGDYEQVMPLPWNRRLFGLRQVYQPVLSQQLGVFGNDVQVEDVQACLVHIPNSFSFVLTTLHHPQAHLLSSDQNSIQSRTNLVIDLCHTYDNLRRAYRKNLRNELNKSIRLNRLSLSANVDQHLNFCLEQLKQKVTIKARQQRQMARGLSYLMESNQGVIYQAHHESGRLLASSFFIKTNRRIINLMSSSTQTGRRSFSMHFLLDQAIRQHAGKAVLFDFEGSEIPGVARFFKSFGAVEQLYRVFRRDRRPWLVRVLRD